MDGHGVVFAWYVALAEAGVVAALADEGCRVQVQVAVAGNVQEAVSAAPVPVLPSGIDAMLGNLPTAHRAPPIGRRGSQPGIGRSTRAIRAPRLRFVYFPVADEDDRRSAYHQHLVTAEVLLDRVLAARAAGLRPMAPALDYAAEARATVRPPRDMFHPATLEYRRWYDHDGSARPEPLTQEALAAQLAVADGLSLEEARHRAARRSHALPATDQAWLIERRNTPLDRRPLNRAEFQILVSAIEGACQAVAGTSHAERANRQIALRVAAMLGSLLDEFVASPFSIAELSQTFNATHVAHLRRTIVNSRQVASDSGVLLAGPKAWFAAKAARMRAEHQIGLALSPGSFPAIRLSAYPVVAVVGGKLRTFVNGWSQGRVRSRAASAAMQLFAAVPG
jgi:hypothetical protein